MDSQITKRAKVFLGIFKDQLKASDYSNSAVIIAFYILLSLFPILIVIGNVVSLIGIDPNTIADYLDVIMPDAIESILGPLIIKLLTQGSASAMSLSIISLLWAATQGISQIETGINKAYGFTDIRTGILQRIVWVLVFIGGLIAVVAAALLLSVGSYVLKNLGPVYDVANNIMDMITRYKWPVVIVLVLLFLTFVYMYMPKTKVKFTDALPGTLLVGTGWIVLTQLFTVYLKFSAKSLNMYGMMSSFFILMFWLNFAAILILIGAVFNSAIQMVRQGTLVEEEHIIDKLEDKAVNKANEVKDEIKKGKNEKDPGS